MKILLVIMLVTLSACDDSAPHEEEPKTLCEKMSDKLYVCVGGRVPITYCSEETAEYILNNSCEQVLEFIRGSPAGR